MILLGNLLYAIHFSSLFPLAGRIMSGLGAGLRAVIYGEMGRVFETRELSRYVAIACMGCSVGYILGPLLNILFENVNFHIGVWHINYTNMPGVYMTVVCMINQVILFLMVHDLSFEYECIDDSLTSEHINTQYSDDDKCSHNEHISKRSDESYNSLNASEYSGVDEPAETELLDKHTKIKNEESSLKSQSFIWNKLSTSVDWILLMTTTFVFGFTVLASDMWYPLVVIKELNWGITALNRLLIESAVIMTLMLALIILKPLSNKLVFICYTSTIIIQMIVFLILLFLKEYHNNYTLNIALLGTFGICYSISGFMHQLPCVVVNQMAPKSSLGYVQGIHQGFYRVGAALGLFLSPLVYQWFAVDVIVISVLSAVLLVCLVARRKYITQPQMLF